MTRETREAGRSATSCCRCLVMAVLAVLAIPLPASPDEIPGPAVKRGTYLEAISLINRYAMFINPKAQGKEVVNKSIKEYLQEKDSFSDYLTPGEYSNFKRTRKGNYAGLGAEVERGPGGSVICFPYPGSPAERAGMAPGDSLEQVNGESVQGKSLYTVAAMVQGREGTTVTLKLRSGHGPARELTVVRRRIRGETVSVQREGNPTVLRIGSFTPQTVAELRRALRKTAKEKPLVIDLRGNRGGDLFAAVDAAGLFLRKGRRVSAMRTRSATKNFHSRADGVATSSRLYLWQDQATASAAEVFIAALTGNSRAVSIGKRSYGKGTRQDVIAMSDGSALVLTTGYLQTPKGVKFDKKGLEPGYPLPERSPSTADYSRHTRELMRQKQRK